MKNKLTKILAGDWENHALPFFWQHGEDDAILLEELHRIYNSGVRAVCAESRPHEGFARDEWWSDMTLLLEECTKLGMDMWILDDKYFPTGYCNGAIREKYPQFGKRAITERHVDVCGPVEGGAVIYEGWADETAEDELLAIIACRCSEVGQELTGECYDITENLHDGLVSVSFPEGMWRVFFIFERPERDGRVDFTNPESTDIMFSEIYEPHFEHLGKYFGNTFKGFFSDEPFIMGRSGVPKRGESNSHGKYPWNKYIKAELTERYGEDWLIHLPALWFTMDGISPQYRVAYMDTVSELYKRHFSGRVGDWCRAHGVQYVGHVVEDNDQHTNMDSGGHYFRALDGQDMAGIDVVLHQIVPGMTNHPNSCNCWYDIADPDFFHYSLAKLAASHAHIQPEKEGRALCEIYGAYGWAEGLKMMKWLTDHMLVRGINYFVPHAFSAKFPDEVPPQFTGAGHNPQEGQFKLLMDYMNRVSTIMSDGYHHTDCAVLYHAEAEWSGGQFMPFYTPAKLLTLGHIDFDVISVDYLDKAIFCGGEMTIGRESYPAIVIPMSEFLPERTLKKLREAADSGVDVIFLDKATRKSCEAHREKISWKDVKNVHTIPAEDVALYLRELDHFDITSSNQCDGLRHYHYSKGGTHAYMLTNEAITEDVRTKLTFDAFDGGEYVVYYPMENKAYLASSDSGRLKIRLEPYESVILFFGELPAELPEYIKYKPDTETVIECEYGVSLYEAEGFPEKEIASFKLSELRNITAHDMYPRFGGFMKYDTTFSYEKPDVTSRYLLDLGRVGETAKVYLNGEYVGDKIAPPYVFDVSSLLRDGENELTVVVTNHLGYEQRDLCSKFLLMEASGLLGPVQIRKTVKA